ncbi:MAG: Gfo/Idh/MocA family oxidoreductase [Chloroflexi bacterium]|nr:Gfo/Idh/MocA family oxidoreductase [Chloroflexota bacterium]
MVNIGVVGCGYWGPKHIRTCHELTDATLATVCDVDERKLSQVRAQYPDVKTTTSFTDMLQNGVDGVVIATPVNTHYRLAREALLHDKHVLVEKPLTATSREALDLIELAEKRGLVLMVGHTYEYHPAVEFLRRLVTNGELGDIYAVDADRLNLGLFRPDVNVLWDLAPHDICIILSLLGEEPVAVSARGTYHVDSSICDVAYLELLFANGTIGHVHVSWLHPRKIREITIVGSKKMAVYDDVSETEKIHIYDKGLAIPADCNSNGNGNGNGNNKFSAWPPNYRYGDVTIPFISSAEPLKLESSHFVKCIREGKTPRSDGWAGYRVVSILEAADRSLANGGQREKINTVKAVAGLRP